MPSGRTHDRITLWSLPWVAAISFLLTHSSELTLIAAGAFLFGGLMFGPDLDIYSIQFRRWGKLRFIWLPYQKCLHHRSIFSHGLILGTMLRLIYLFTWIGFIAVFVVAIAQVIWDFDWNWHDYVNEIVKLIVDRYHQEAIAMFIGLELGSISHSLSDWTFSLYKRNRKKSTAIDREISQSNTDRKIKAETKKPVKRK